MGQFLLSVGLSKEPDHSSIAGLIHESVAQSATEALINVSFESLGRNILCCGNSLTYFY